MSPQTAEGWVLKLARERDDLTPSELHVLSVLAMRHNRDYGAAHPKVDLLHRETHISVRQIVRILNALAEQSRRNGPVLHVSFGPLPMENKAGNPVYGNVYRFVGFDEIPATTRPRRRDVVDSRPKRGDAMSRAPSDAMSPGRGDTGNAGKVTSGGGAGDAGNAGKVTSASSPLYPVKNPDSFRSEERKERRNPDLNPERVRARSGILETVDGVVQDSAAEQLWGRACEQLKEWLDPAHFEAYLSGARAVSFDSGRHVLQVAAPNSFSLPWLEGRLAEPIRRAVADVVGQSVRVDWRSA